MGYNMSARSFDLFGTRKRFGTVTIIKDPINIYVKLHRTIVVLYNKDTTEIVLNSGGWQTVTTKTCINQALIQLKNKARVYQEKGEWFLFTRDEKIPFYDGMIIPIYNNQ